MDVLFRKRLDEIRAAVDVATWRGLAGTTDLLVLRELLLLAELRGTAVVGINLRSIAERCGLSLNAVWKATRRLRTRGFLKVATASRRPDRWRLCCPPNAAFANKELREDRLPYKAKYCSRTPQADLDITVAGDLWRGRGFGKVRQRIYATLGRGHGWAPTMLAEVVGCHRRTVERALRAFERHGLAARDNRVWRCGPSDPNDVAEALGLSGAGAQQRARHQREREIFRARLRQARERSVRVDHETGEVLEEHEDLVAYALRRLGLPVKVRETACSPPEAALR